MTKDRALQVLHVYASVNGSGQCTQDEFEEAKKMAIEALKGKEPNVPSVDAISRQDVLGRLLAYHTKSFDLKGRYYPHEVIGWLVIDISKNLFADMIGEQE